MYAIDLMCDTSDHPVIWIIDGNIKVSRASVPLFIKENVIWFDGN